ncbi:MAG TPA: hypothetical protein VGR97_14855 [Candidatus Acidoferrales bacterium]|nr:hypothetical protein [Candidatus Acidoferrales bacterium]
MSQYIRLPNYEGPDRRLCRSWQWVREWSGTGLVQRQCAEPSTHTTPHRFVREMTASYEGPERRRVNVGVEVVL